MTTMLYKFANMDPTFNSERYDLGQNQIYVFVWTDCTGIWT